jgi:hypothetical protein
MLLLMLLVSAQRLKNRGTNSGGFLEHEVLVPEVQDLPPWQMCRRDGRARPL